MHFITFGSDFEVSVLNNGTPVVPSELTFMDITPTPTTIMEVDGVEVMVHDDSGLLEFSTPTHISSSESATPITDIADFISKVKEMIAVQANSNELTFDFSSPLTVFTEMNKQRKEGLQVLGCNPDINTILFGSDDEKQAADQQVCGNVRTVGGHLHIRFNPQEITSYKADDVVNLVKGISLVGAMADECMLQLMDDATKLKALQRRCLYGEPGAARVSISDELIQIELRCFSTGFWDAVTNPAMRKEASIILKRMDSIFSDFANPEKRDSIYRILCSMPLIDPLSDIAKDYVLSSLDQLSPERTLYQMVTDKKVTVDSLAEATGYHEFSKNAERTYMFLTG